jgi:hypothetical protein
MKSLAIHAALLAGFGALMFTGTVSSTVSAATGGHGGGGWHGRYYGGGYGGWCLDPMRGYHWCPNDTAHPRIDN